MKNKELVNEIVEFLFECQVFNDEPVTLEEMRKIEKGLEEAFFVEELIGILMNYVKNCKETNFIKMKALYLKLNDLRFDLEYKGKAN